MSTTTSSSKRKSPGNDDSDRVPKKHRTTVGKGSYQPFPKKLPEGWASVKHVNGLVFYQNNHSNVISWSVPYVCQHNAEVVDFMNA